MFPSILRLKEKWEVHQLCELMKRMKITPVMHWVAISCTHRILDEKGTPEISASSRLKAAKGPKCFPKGFREASCRITNKTHGPAELTAELPHSWSFSPASGRSWCSSTAALPLGCPSCLPERKITRPRPPKRTQNPSHVSFASTSYGCPTPRIRRMNRTDFSMSRCKRSPILDTLKEIRVSCRFVHIPISSQELKYSSTHHQLEKNCLAQLNFVNSPYLPYLLASCLMILMPRVSPCFPTGWYPLVI